MPRLWMTDPRKMCQRHLVAEHHECHVFLGKLRKKHRLDGYIAANLFSASDLYWRHEALVSEMRRRGYAHATPFPTRAEVVELAAYLPSHPIIDREAAGLELRARCASCFNLGGLKT